MSRPEYLRELAEADRERGASPQVEWALHRALAARRRRVGMAWAGSAAAAVLVMTWMAWPTGSPVGPRQAVTPPVPVTERADPPAAAPPVTASRPVVRRPGARPVSRVAGPREYRTEFVSLTGEDRLSLRDLDLVRVQLDRSALAMLGVPAWGPGRANETVLADVLVSREGVPRAYRLVRREE
jgi:hypothetical protein